MKELERNKAAQSFKITSPRCGSLVPLDVITFQEYVYVVSSEKVFLLQSSKKY